MYEQDSGQKETEGETGALRDADVDSEAAAARDASASAVSSMFDAASDAASALDATSTDASSSTFDAASDAGATLDSASDGSGATLDAASDASADDAQQGDACARDGGCQAVDPACAVNNGGCSQRCLGAGSAGALCGCWLGFKLLSDNRSCAPFAWSTPVNMGMAPPGFIYGTPGPAVRVRANGDALVLWESGGSPTLPAIISTRIPGDPTLLWNSYWLANPPSEFSALNLPIRLGVVGLPDGRDLALLDVHGDPHAGSAQSGAWSDLQSLQIAEPHALSGSALAWAGNEAGQVLAVWSALQDARTHIWGRSYTAATGWSAAFLVSQDLAWSSSEPQVAIDAAGAATVTWQQDDGARLRVHARRYLFGVGLGDAHGLALRVTLRAWSGWSRRWRVCRAFRAVRGSQAPPVRQRTTKVGSGPAGSPR